jgi:hypothetical protein
MVLDILTAVPVKNTTFWDVMSCGLAEVYKTFQGYVMPPCSVSKKKTKEETALNPEDGGNIYLRNFGGMLADCTT